MAEVTTTANALFDGQLVLLQPARGYRFNVDSVLLAAFARRRLPARTVYDLGAGVGAVGLSLWHLGGARQVVFVEKDATVAKLARENARANGLLDAGILAGDALMAAHEHRGRADMVVCNPPYFPEGSGRLAKDAARAKSRAGKVDTFVTAARLLLGRRGRAYFIYPPQELVTLLARFREAGLEPKRMRMVHASRSRPARVALLEVVPAKPGGLIVEPPLVEWDAPREPSPEMRALLTFRRGDRFPKADPG